MPLTHRLGASTHSLGSLFQCLPTLLAMKYFLTSNLNLPWHSFEPFPHKMSLDNLYPSPLQGAVESHEVTSQPSFLQTRQTQSPQPLLTGHSFQPFHHLQCPSLDAFKYLSVTLLESTTKMRVCVLVLTEVAVVHDHSAHSACLLKLYSCFALPCSNQVARQHWLDPKALVTQHSTQSSPSQLFSVLHYLYFSGYICTPLLLLLVILVCLSLAHTHLVDLKFYFYIKSMGKLLDYIHCMSLQTVYLMGSCLPWFQLPVTKKIF